MKEDLADETQLLEPNEDHHEGSTPTHDLLCSTLELFYADHTDLSANSACLSLLPPTSGLNMSNLVQKSQPKNNALGGTPVVE